MQPVSQETQQKVDTRLEAAIAGAYGFSLNTLFDEAWAKTKGFKSIYWGALGITVLLAMGYFLFTAVTVGAIGVGTGAIVNDHIQLVTPLEKALTLPMPIFVSLIILTLIALFIFLPLIAGLWMMSIYHISGLPIHIKMVFAYFKKPYRYWLANLWVSLIVQGGNAIAGPLAKFLGASAGTWLYWVCVVLGFIIQLYAFVSYFFVVPILADRKLGVWRALESNRKAIGKHWFKVFGTLLMIFLVCIIIPGLVIGLLTTVVHSLMLAFLIIFIWLVPFYALSTAILYRDIFGVMAVEQIAQREKLSSL
jgi:hypothetical protein